MNCEHLKPGNEVVIEDGSWYHGSKSARTVERVTKTQIILQGYPVRFRRDIGRGVGSYVRTRIESSDPAVIAATKHEIRRLDIATQLRNTDWATRDLETLQRIMDVLQQDEAKKDATE